MTSKSSPEEEFLRAVLDANPDLMFVVDEDMRILEYNRAAGQFLSSGGPGILRRKGGDALHCIHSLETPEGCGHSPHCRVCPVRNSVKESFQGRSVVRRKARLELVSDGKPKDLPALITTSPFQHGEKDLALLVIEDMSEMEEIRRFIPICSSCKKIRDDGQYWSELEAYFKDHMDLDFTHGLCPQCFEKLMEEVQRLEKRPGREEGLAAPAGREGGSGGERGKGEK